MDKEYLIDLIENDYFKIDFFKNPFELNQKRDFEDKDILSLNSGCDYYNYEE